MNRQRSPDYGGKSWRENAPGSVRVRHHHQQSPQSSPPVTPLSNHSSLLLSANTRTRANSTDRFGPKPTTKDFDVLKTDCLKRRILYEDAEFPAVDTSLYYSRHPPYMFEWMRPPVSIKISKNIKFFTKIVLSKVFRGAVHLG